MTRRRRACIYTFLSKKLFDRRRIHPLRGSHTPNILGGFDWKGVSATGILEGFDAAKTWWATRVEIDGDAGDSRFFFI
ncbi:hypothetical protein M9435_000273 [Picochlorum sp. BPE23]|nr:hypothetical protein M9435_000273 [Picochlorum sp. BPE23]